MKFLFVHNNFPAQFGNLAEALAKDPSNSVAAIGAQTSRPIANIKLQRYHMPAVDLSGTHSFARRFHAECHRAEQVLFAASALAASGFSPDVVIVHCGWGESLPLRAMFPKARIIVYCEFYYRSEGQDVHFDPESSRLGADGVAGLQCKNASTLIALAECDMGISPTYWQRSTFPKEFHEKIKVMHEGVDLQKIRPSETARFTLPGGRTLHRADEIVTFAARNLEPMRGYHVFMRAVPEILKARPEAQIVIVGGDGSSYSPPAPGGINWKTFCLNENLGRLDLSRVHFLDHLQHDEYIRLLQVSSAHVYLTYPFVLSWSLIEAMAAGCAIVASDTAPVTEVIDGRNGVLVPFHDSNAIADAVIEVVAKPRHYSAFRKRARKTVLDRFDKRICVPQALALMGLDRSEPDPSPELSLGEELLAV
jgi:glycosyltransferase involved in cell wall biosynthesis